MPRRPWHAGRFLADNLAGYCQARSFLRREGVGLVVGLGGFASAAMARAAIDRRVPLVLLEQNAVPGRATRWLAPSADAVCLAFERSLDHFKPGCKLHVTGNPLRAGFVRNRKASPTNPKHQQGTTSPTSPAIRGTTSPASLALRAGVVSERGASETSAPQLLVLGGSGGARALNESVPLALGRLGERLRGWSIVHQTGPADWDATRRLYQRLGVPATVVRFVSDMPGLLQRTAVAVCRAGGTTLAELAATGVPAILVPYPHAADDHQRRNAEAYGEAGGCLVLDQREGTGCLDARLAEALRPLLADAALRRSMSRAMRRAARPRAADEVVAIIRRLVA